MSSTHILLYPSVPLKFSSVAGVTDHWACLGFGRICVNCQLILRAAKVGYTFCVQDEINVLLKNPTWMDPSAQVKVKIHIQLLRGVIFAVLSHFRGTMLGCIFDKFRLNFLMYSHPICSFPQYLARQCFYRTFSTIWSKICTLTLCFRGCLVLEKCQNVELRNVMWS